MSLVGNNSMRCRKVRAQFSALTDRDGGRLGTTERSALNSHLDGCVRCAREYRLYTLGRSALQAAGSSEPIAPDKEFFVALRARIVRGPIEAPPANRGNIDESWAAALLLTARQLLPAMAMLLALIIGATVIWNRSSQNTGELALRPSELIVLGDIYEYRPTADDVLETLVVVEDRENGR
jgi:anti-sigma factor RsiW